ncbi:MAG: AAA family ATPase [Bacteroidota bacterium]|nr:AAA family ATPase [Bacteroidota bacterium]
MTELQQILENSKVTKKQLTDNLLHPYLQTELQPREIFDEIKENTDTYFQTGNGVRAFGFAGLRGTGKTTLLWQTANYIYDNYTQNIYFFNLQDLIKYNVGIWELKDAFKEYLVKDHLSAYKEKIVIIFDEVHESSMWAKALKVLYDEFRIAFILSSGSSALLLQSTADLVTRMIIQHILPLSFLEYISFTHKNIANIKGIRKKLEDVILRSDNIKELSVDFKNIQNELDKYINKIDNINDRIKNYIIYHNIIRFLLIKSDTLIEKHIRDLVKRVVYEDIPKLNKENTNPHLADKILRRIAGSDEINIQTLSQSIGISQKEINSNLEILVNAELLNVLYAYGGIDSKISKSQKYFFMSPSIRKAILSPMLKSNTDGIYAKMLEDTIVLYLKRIFQDDSFLSFSSVKGNKNPDLIIETLNKPILLEIGINKKTTKQISKSKIKYKYGIVINSKIEDIEIHNDIVIIPLKYFLLL